MAKSILKEFMGEDVNKLGFNNQIENIHYKKIKPAAKNRGLRRIEELAEDISEDGLENCLTIRKVEDGEFDYELVAGERRYTAIKHNIEHGDDTYEYIPCKVVVLDDIEARKRLILNNYQNDPLKPSEKLDAIEELKSIYKAKKASGDSVPGRIQNLIADELGMKKSQVGNYEKILNNAIPEVRDMIGDGELTINAAAELSSLDDDDQLMFVEEADDYDIKTIKEYKDTLKQDENSEELVDKKTVKECMMEISYLYSCLIEKLDEVEWRDEIKFLENAVSAFNDFETELFK